jgi:hypothetical protein
MRLLLRGGPAAVKEFEFPGTANNIKAGKTKNMNKAFSSPTQHMLLLLFYYSNK